MRTLRQPLRFGQGNAKLDDAIFTFSLPAGWTCPGAHICLSKTNPNTGRLKDGPDTQFRCYAASMECRRPSVRDSRWHNFNLLKACETRKAMTRLILDSLSPFAGYVRIHDSGDYFSQRYFDAWLDVVRARPDTRFYAYVKNLKVWVKRLAIVGDGFTPGDVENLVLTASWGGKWDELIQKHGLRSARVVYGEELAEQLGLEVDHDDSHAMSFGPDFALLIHGMQPKGSEAGKAVQKLRESGWSGYGKRELPVLS